VESVVNSSYEHGYAEGLQDGSKHGQDVKAPDHCSTSGPTSLYGAGAAIGVTPEPGTSSSLFDRWNRR
jgi:hypothetical protein